VRFALFRCMAGERAQDQRDSHAPAPARLRLGPRSGGQHLHPEVVPAAVWRPVGLPRTSPMSPMATSGRFGNSKSRANHSMPELPAIWSFLYRGGADGMTIYGARLVDDQGELATDDHEGWSGA